MSQRSNRRTFRPALTLCAGIAMAISAAPALAQNAAAPAATQPAAVAKPLSIGDNAPALKIEKFLKGEPVTGFEKGKVYVVEFWATWCGPCIAAFPHLSEMQASHKDVTFIGTNIWERPYDADTLSKVTKFVEKQGDKMSYTVAYDGESKAMDKAYMAAAGKSGIPCAFIVNQDSKIAWIGHPMQMEEHLNSIASGKHDLAKAAKAYEAEMAEERAQTAFYKDNGAKLDALQQKIEDATNNEKWDDAIAAYDDMYKLSPRYMSSSLVQKFTLLLTKKKDTAAAYAMKPDLLANENITKNAQLLNELAWSVVDPEAEVAKRDADFALAFAAKADQVTNSSDPMIIDTLARVYWVKGDKAKAVQLQEKAVALSEKLQPKVKKGIADSLAEYKKEKN